MRFVAFAISAALLGVMSLTPANALPASGAKQAIAGTSTQGVELIAHKPGHKKYGKKNYFGPKPHYRPGGRYSHAPKGWHRHSKRPAYWQTRGCIVVGPVWFCP